MGFNTFPPGRYRHHRRRPGPQQQQLTNEKNTMITIPLDSDTEIELVPVPGGTTRLGPCQNNGHRGSFEPLVLAGPETCQEVAVTGFWMGRYQVTQAQYQTVMGDNPTHEHDHNPKNPVTNVLWDEAVKFCTKLSELSGKRFTLPNEGQWEHACRAGTTTAYHFGDTLNPTLANYEYVGSRTRPAAVGSYPPNAFGLFDMHGNVLELCLDPWTPDYSGLSMDDQVKAGFEPLGPKVARGGSFFDDDLGCMSNYRYRWEGCESCGSVGFRVVCLDNLEP